MEVSGNSIIPFSSGFEHTVRYSYITSLCLMQVVKKNVIENIVPIVVSLKHMVSVLVRGNTL